MRFYYQIHFPIFFFVLSHFIYFCFVSRLTIFKVRFNWVFIYISIFIWNDFVLCRSEDSTNFCNVPIFVRFCMCVFVFPWIHFCRVPYLRADFYVNLSPLLDNRRNHLDVKMCLCMYFSNTPWRYGQFSFCVSTIPVLLPFFLTENQYLVISLCFAFPDKFIHFPSSGYDKWIFDCSIHKMHNYFSSM